MHNGTERLKTMAKSIEAHQALLDMAKGEYQYLAESKEKDGFDLSELMILDGTDEELHIAFSLQLNDKIANITYSIGFDADEGAYWPYVEIEAGDEQAPIAFSSKHTGGKSYVRGEQDLLDSIERLGGICGEARFEAFRWIIAQDIDQPRG